MKTFKLSALAMAAALFYSCSSENDFNAPDQASKQALTIEAVAGEFEAANADTRVVDNGTATQFEAGDKMGLYVIEKPGTDAAKVLLRNVPLTYTKNDADNTYSWKNTGGNIYYYEGADYVAYFPYNENLASDIAAAEVETKIKEAGDKILADNKDKQNEAGIYSASDLMMAKITATDLTNQETANKTLTFDLKHQYAMVEITIPTYKYTDTNPYTQATINYNVAMTIQEMNLSYGSTTTATFNNFFDMGNGSYRYLLTPSAEATVAVEGKFLDPKDLRPVKFNNTNSTYKRLTAGQYVGYNVTYDGAPGTDAEPKSIIGSYFCQNGSIVPADFSISADQKIVGIVAGYVGTKEFPAELGTLNCYVMCIKSAKDQLGPTIGSGFTAVAFPTIAQMTGDVVADMSGYANTSILKNQASGNIWHYKFTDKGDFGKDNYKIASTVSKTGWFIPSMGQWHRVQKDFTDTKVEITYTGGANTGKWNSSLGGAMYTSLVSSLEKLAGAYPDATNSKEFKQGSLFWSSTMVTPETDTDETHDYFYAVEIKNNDTHHLFEFQKQKVSLNTDSPKNQRVVMPFLAF